MIRTQIAADTARALRSAATANFPALLGFDGFVDDIIDVVDERPQGGANNAYDQYTRIPTLSAYANRLAATAGHGTNLELVVKRQKLGGQGPIMANALALLGLPVTYVGSVGDGPDKIHPVFHDFAARATLISLADAARTHALEFDDGKVMMGELAPLSQITFDRLLQIVGQDQLIALCENAALLGLLNWTMIPASTTLWRRFAEEIVPHLKHKPRIFIDLADPKKRTHADLAQAMAVLTHLNSLGTPVTLGLNQAESQQVAEAINVTQASSLPVAQTVPHACGRLDPASPIPNSQSPTPPSALRARAAAIRQTLALDTVVIHPTACAVAATISSPDSPGTSVTAEFAGPYTTSPKILTGGGDHFNAGFALAQLIQLPLENALCLATATSGYYVRHAASPTAQDLAQFLDALPESK